MGRKRLIRLWMWIQQDTTVGCEQHLNALPFEWYFLFFLNYFIYFISVLFLFYFHFIFILFYFYFILFYFILFYFIFLFLSLPSPLFVTCTNTNKTGRLELLSLLLAQVPLMGDG